MEEFSKTITRIENYYRDKRDKFDDEYDDVSKKILKTFNKNREISDEDARKIMNAINNINQPEDKMDSNTRFTFTKKESPHDKYPSGYICEMLI